MTNFVVNPEVRKNALGVEIDQPVDGVVLSLTLGLQLPFMILGLPDYRVDECTGESEGVGRRRGEKLL